MEEKTLTELNIVLAINDAEQRLLDLHEEQVALLDSINQSMQQLRDLWKLA